MPSEQNFESVTVDALLARTREMCEQGYRLVQIGATTLPGSFELTYSFDRLDRLVHLRLPVPASEAHLPSISAIYWCAFIYENEIQDLFHIRVDGMAVDFHGQFYNTSVKYAFGSTQTPAIVPLPASPSTPAPAAPTGALAS